MSYTPNFNDPRVVRAANKALDWVGQYLSINNEQWLSTREIQRHLGSQSRPLGRWLRFKLLITVNNYYDPFNGQCKTYRLNDEGYFEICSAIKRKPSFGVNQKIQQQLDTGEFEYKDVSNRSFTALQYMPKQRRRSVLENNGYTYHYDIQAAAPTLLLQRAQQLIKQKQINGIKSKELKTPYLDQYVNDRKSMREQLAKDCDCTENTIKLVINAILQGAVLSKSQYSSIFKELHCDYDLMTRLQNNNTIKCLKEEIKILWGVLAEDIPEKYITTKSGSVRRKSLSGRDKSAYYRQLEEQVAKIIRKNLKKERNRYLWIHDGWSCEKMIFEESLIAHVRQLSGFNIKLDKEIFDSLY